MRRNVFYVVIESSLIHATKRDETVPEGPGWHFSSSSSHEAETPEEALAAAMSPSHQVPNDYFKFAVVGPLERRQWRRQWDKECYYRRRGKRWVRR